MGQVWSESNEKALIRGILSKAGDYRWSIQGFGMLRLSLTDETRLNVWDSRYRATNVSMMHTHPWDFESMIVAGELENVRFTPSHFGHPYEHAFIKPGPGGGIRENKGMVRLHRMKSETYLEGDKYRQNDNEIHISLPEDGTVTLNRRKRTGDDIAYVYWPVNTSWVSAEPRPATKAEVMAITQNALERWFSIAPITA